MNEKNKKVIIPIIVFFTIMGIVSYYYAKGRYAGFSHFETIGLEFYYVLQSPSLYLIFFFFVAFFSANLFPIDFFKYRNNRFQNQIITRIGYQKQFIYQLKKTLVSSILFRLLCHLVLLLITLCYFPKMSFVIHGMEGYTPILYVFSNSTLLSFILYIIYSTVGFAIFSMFIYSLSYYIKNIYIYRVAGIVFSLLGYIGPALIGNTMMANGVEAIVIQVIGYLFFSGSLLAPGMDILGDSDMNIHILTLITMFCYSVVTVLLLYIGYKREYQNG